MQNKFNKVSRRDLLKRAGTIAAAGAASGTLFAPSIVRAAPVIEKEELKFGFIKLTDMAPIAIAKEMDFFEDEGLYVTVEPQANWKVLLDRVITGELDGAHMLAGQPLGATIGFGTKAHVITPFSMDLNGNGITVSNAVWEEMKKYFPMGSDGKPVHPIKADVLKKVVDTLQAPRARRSTWAWCSRSRPTITSCATGWRPAGLIPGFYSPTDISGQIMGDVLLSVTPPPQMPATLRGRHHSRLLRRRAVESASGVQGHRRSGHHRLRDLEEQSREGVRRHRRFRRKASQHTCSLSPRR